MIVPVHMVAFLGKDKVREVEVPDERLDNCFGWSAEETINYFLELVFHYGQNEHQPQDYPSISRGDVIKFNENYYIIKAIGFDKISEEQFNNIKVPNCLNELS